MLLIFSVKFGDNCDVTMFSGWSSLGLHFAPWAIQIFSEGFRNFVIADTKSIATSSSKYRNLEGVLEPRDFSSKEIKTINFYHFRFMDIRIKLIHILFNFSLSHSFILIFSVIKSSDNTFRLKLRRCSPISIY